MIRTLDIFSGAGGSSWGAQAAGARIVSGIDLWPVATHLYQHNFPNATAINGRLEDLDPSEFQRKHGDIDLLLASPECTNHTCAKGARERCEDSRATAFQVTRWAEVLRPRAIVIENVVSMQRWDRFGEFMATLRQGYTVRAQALVASDFGVPQSRRRLFLTCVRDDLTPGADMLAPVAPVKTSAPTVADKVVLDRDAWAFTKLRTERRAKDTLARADRAVAELGAGTPFLIVYYGSDAAGGWQSVDRPLRTVTTLDRFALIVWRDGEPWMRMLQPPELRRAMGFDDDYDLVDVPPLGGRKVTRRSLIKAMGNGVCPPVMAAIVEGLRRVGVLEAEQSQSGTASEIKRRRVA